MAQNPLNKVAVTVGIANGTADSSVIDCLEQTLSGIITPSALSNGTMRFKGSVDGSTFYDLYNGDTQYSIAVATNASRAISLNLAVMKPWRYIEISMSGNESAARSFGYTLTGV